MEYRSWDFRLINLAEKERKIEPDSLMNKANCICLHDFPRLIPNSLDLSFG